LRLTELSEGTETNDVISQRAHPNPEITGLTADSRLVEPGFLFAALPGASVDGRAYIPQALRNGAAAILAPQGFDLKDWAPDAPTQDTPGHGVNILTDPDPRRRLARMAARFYDAQPDTIAAITGTNGKTSVASFTRQIWTALGYKAAATGTLGLTAPNMSSGPGLTTPDPVQLHKTLAELKSNGVDFLAMEASSHGLDQRRLDGVCVTAAAFTNLSRDHLDYHHTMAAYRSAKIRLFDTLLAPGGLAVAPAGAPEMAIIAAIAAERGHKLLTYGRILDSDSSIDIACRTATPHNNGWALSLEILGASYDIKFELPGAFQIDNALCALALVIGGGGDPAEATNALATLEGVPGRLEHVATCLNGASIYVDYAHTPDALETVLHALRPHVSGQLSVVFGCGGDRDTGKRPEMGAIAAQLADQVIITDDNPRSENATDIRAAILTECPKAQDIGDRRRAIETAISALGPHDALLIAGKGHETGQIVGDNVTPFNDSEVARNAITEQDSTS
jgi:UDP-N-acetylmuramoyl-L-alanyl-D-glutamate--2,6-diaminopimelate ligase